MARAPLWPSDETQVSSLASILTAPSEARRIRSLPDQTYRADPVGWAADVLGISSHTIRWSENPGYRHHQWDGTPDPLAAIANGIAGGKDVGVESGTGTGKTWLGGWLAPWFLTAFENAIVVTVAPKQEQLELHLWKELNANFTLLRKAYPTLSRAHLRMRAMPVEVEDDDDWSQERWAIIGYGCGVDAETSAQGSLGAASKAKGFHAPHMLIITEETQGMPPSVMTALRNTCTGDHNIRLAFGNPESQSDPLHGFCVNTARSGGLHVRVSALDHPNVVLRREVIPGAVGAKSVDDRRVEYQDVPDLFNAQVRGVSPAQAAQSLIRREWLEEAASRYSSADLRRGVPALGVDVANSETGDRAAISRWQGACLLEVETRICPNANQLGRDVLAEMKRDGILPEHVGIDPVGVGAGTANVLLEQSYRVHLLGGANAPLERSAKGANGESYEWVSDANNWNNLRSQMWWQLREDLRLGRIAVPRDDALWQELTTPRFRVHNGKTVIEPKDDIRKRLGRSPDRGDAVVYGNWVRQRKTPTLAEAPARDAVGRDGGVMFRTVDGLPPRWIGPEGQFGEQSNGYASELPINI